MLCRDHNMLWGKICFGCKENINHVTEQKMALMILKCPAAIDCSSRWRSPESRSLQRRNTDKTEDENRLSMAKPLILAEHLKLFSIVCGHMPQSIYLLWVTMKYTVFGLLMTLSFLYISRIPVSLPMIPAYLYQCLSVTVCNVLFIIYCVKLWWYNCYCFKFWWKFTLKYI